VSRNQPTISKGIDWSLVWIYFILSAIGIMAVFAVTYKDGDPVIQSFLGFKTDYSKQFYFFVVSFFVGLFILLTDSKFFTATANIWYATGIFLLLLVFAIGVEVDGTKSIIRIGPIQFQPAEFCKISVALALAKFLSRPETDFSQRKSQIIAAAIALFPAAISILQSETGLALVYFAFFLVMYREGLPSGIILMGFSVVVLFIAAILVPPNTLAIILTAIAVLMIYFLRRTIKRKRELLIKIIFIWLLCVGIQRFAVPFVFANVLQKHQVERIFDLFGIDNPYQKDDGTIVKTKKQKESGSQYNVRQSKIAIGSGRITGKGLLKGTQTRYGFVPAQRTDFIFDTIGEGFGFIGSVVLLGIFLIMLFRIVTIAERQRSAFSRCYAYGVGAVFFFHIFINVAMAVGLAPVIGIPLPFLSYGGTSLLTNSILLFILIRLDADRQMVLR
jgi:rod shape determining protein RodA